MKKYLILILSIMVAIACCACASSPGQTDGTETTPPADSENEQADDDDDDEFLDDLIKDEYSDIEITANVLERNAILPGMVFQVTVTVKNNGDKTLHYVQGSGSFTTPEAVFLKSDALQTIPPKDQLGLVTMDFVTKELAPGESLLFKLPAIAIEPNADFVANTQDLFLNEGVYIADLDWTALSDKFPDLIAVQPGSYDMSAFFSYTLKDDAYDGPTGYAQADTVITIS